MDVVRTKLLKKIWGGEKLNNKYKVDPPSSIDLLKKADCEDEEDIVEEADEEIDYDNILGGGGGGGYGGVGGGE